MKFPSIFLFLSTMIVVILGSQEKREGVLDKIKAGLEYATNYLETAKDIANLVAKSLGTKQSQQMEEDIRMTRKANFGTSNLMSAFFRLIGLDSGKVTAIAVNSVIFLAQMISSLFDLKTPEGSSARNLRGDEFDDSSWNPAKFITESKNAGIQGLIEQAHDESLSERLMEKVDGMDSACIRLLLCKTSPVIRAVQHFLKNKTHGKSHLMTSWMPSRSQFEENSDGCENTHTDCSLFS